MREEGRKEAREGWREGTKGGKGLKIGARSPRFMSADEAPPRAHVFAIHHEVEVCGCGDDSSMRAICVDIFV